MNRTRLFAILASVLFAGLIASPLVGGAAGWGKATRTENRRFAKRPAWPNSLNALQAFPRQFEAYYDDHFAFRPWLVRIHHRLKVFGLGMSSTDQVLKGKEGWYFYMGNQIRKEDPVSDCRAVHPLDEDHLLQWQRVLEERRDLLAERNIAYLVVLVPNKARIYPEFLPRGVRADDRVGPYDQFIRHFAEHSTLNVLDVAPALREAKPVARLYHKLDSHWNAAGGFVGYREVMGALPARGVAVEDPFTFGDVVIETREGDAGELASLMGVEGRLKEEHILLKPRNALTFSQEKLSDEDWSILTRTGNPELPTGMAVGDSFIGGFAPFISEHFEWFIYHPTYNKFDLDEIEAREPDVVIEEVLERFLRDRISNPSASEGAGPLRGAPGAGYSSNTVQR